MKPYGLRKQDRVICAKKNCTCGDFSSKHPLVMRKGIKNKRMKKQARQSALKLIND
jgi:hypothetical protein